MHDRVLMAKFNPEWSLLPGSPMCSCGETLHKDEVVAMYPIPEEDWHYREAVCLTCHFWLCHEVMEELEDAS